MIELIILADDFTGALDTGVQFAGKGIETQIVVDTIDETTHISQTARVLAVDLETRSLPPEEAYKAVYKAVKWSLENHIPGIYKKTDSALRGNAGAELKAVADATGDTVYFIPAYPAMNRVTIGGIHYIDAIPLHQSVFGRDPYEPARFCYVPDLLKHNMKMRVKLAVQGEDIKKGDADVVVFDAQSDQDIISITTVLKKNEKLNLLAGCAGFAEWLPEALEMKQGMPRQFIKKKGLFVACGSLNPITRDQIEYAEQRGFIRINLKPWQKFEPVYYSTENGLSFLQSICAVCKTHTCIIVDSFDIKTPDSLKYAEKKGIPASELRHRVTRCHSIIMNYLMNERLDLTYLVTGGDTLMGVMRSITPPDLLPIKELCKGVAISELFREEEPIQIVSKSGGFGERDLLVWLAKQLII